jgi:hypothetical protein
VGGRRTDSAEANKSWVEDGIAAGLSFTRRTGGSELYGAASVVGARPLGADRFDNRSQGAVRPERAFAGWRTRRATGVSVDLSLGSQEYAIGTSAGGSTDAMLVRMGAGHKP